MISAFAGNTEVTYFWYATMAIDIQELDTILEDHGATDMEMGADFSG